jgi:hypothetical protein
VLHPESLRTRAVHLAVALSLFAVPALADQGAFSVDIGGGLSAVRVQAPYSTSGSSQVGTAPFIWLDGRYAFTNHFEIVGSAFFEANVPFYISNTTIPSDAGNLTGTLEMNARRFALLGGARFLHGNVWRFIVGADAGWAFSSYSSMHLIDDSNPSGPRDFGLVLADKSVSSLVLAPCAGIAWVGDKLSITLLPRFQVLIGDGTSWAVTVPLTIGWDFYL